MRTRWNVDLPSLIFGRAVFKLCEDARFDGQQNELARCVRSVFFSSSSLSLRVIFRKEKGSGVSMRAFFVFVFFFL